MGLGPDAPTNPNTPKVLILASKFCLTSVSSMAAEGATYPIDFTKTRLQLQGEAGFTGTRYSFFGMMQNIVKTEGMGGLYQGFTPALARHIPYTGFRAIGYEVRRGGDAVASGGWRAVEGRHVTRRLPRVLGADHRVCRPRARARVPVRPPYTPVRARSTFAKPSAVRT